jgi:hypothetical protein
LKTYPHHKAIFSIITLTLSVISSACAPESNSMETNKEIDNQVGIDLTQDMSPPVVDGIRVDKNPIDMEDPDLQSSGELERSCLSITHNESEMSGCLDESSFNAEERCGLSNQLTDHLKSALIQWSEETGSDIQIEEVICEDLDSDCYYQCQGWTLDPQLQDLDDRRSSITDSNGNQTDITLTESTCISINGEFGVHVCNEDLPQDESEPLQVFPCINDAIAWVTQNPEDSAQWLVHLANLKFGSNQERQSFQIPINVYPTELVCFFDENTPSMLLNTADEGFEDHLFVLENSVTGFHFNSFSLDVEEDDLIIALRRPQDLHIDNSGLKWWTSTTSTDHISINDEAEQQWIAKLYQFRTSAQPYPRGVISARFTQVPNDNGRSNERGVYLMNDSSVKLVDNGYDYDLFEREGPFKMIKSSDSLLGLVPDQEQNTEIIFSLWAEPISNIGADSLPFIPLVFNAQLWGYRSVELHSINGMNALVKLTKLIDDEFEAGQIKTVWGVYNVINDHLQSFEQAIDPEILSHLGLVNHVRWGQPSLHDHGISWTLFDEGVKVISFSF